MFAVFADSHQTSKILPSKITLRRGKPYYDVRHPQKLNSEKFVDGLSVKILILENF